MTATPSRTAKAAVLPVPKRARPPAERETLYTYGALPAEEVVCFFAQFSSEPCSGRMERAHLVRAQTIRREVGRARAVIWCPAVWRHACFRHHWMFDQAKTLIVPRSAIPADTEQWAAEHGLTWWLDRTYREAAC